MKSPSVLYWDHHTKRKKSYAKLEIPTSNFQRIQRMRRKRGGRRKCIRLTSCRQKGALMKFYDVALAQGVHDKVLTYDFSVWCREANEARATAGSGRPSISRSCSTAASSN